MHISGTVQTLNFVTKLGINFIKMSKYSCLISKVFLYFHLFFLDGLNCFVLELENSFVDSLQTGLRGLRHVNIDLNQYRTSNKKKGDMIGYNSPV